MLGALLFRVLWHEHGFEMNVNMLIGKKVAK